ncbi:MAG: hypothetical protein PPP56_09600 [Longimonas sp.]|uniref:hypothetical protein n=1 Tax=Longimonas sp. TaxID=2039626 RepID=UPI00335E4203
MLLVGLTVPHTSTAQSIWSSPFDPAPEDEQEETTPWGAPSETPTYSNPWGSDEEDDDPWGYNPWDTSYDDPWDTSSNRSGGSDWSSDFYDFDDHSGSRSADRVGDGPAMANDLECTSNLDCPGNRVCCTDEDGSTSCGSGGNNPCGNGPSDDGDPTPIDDDEVINDDGEIIDCGGEGPLPQECGEICGNGNGVDCAEVVPVDGALLYLVIMGVAYGVYKLRGL